jgi:signal transduction histidine kinase/ActR/RegA family two-component response regulator
MRVLVVGNGAREHALCWKLRQSPLLRELYCAPGNPGIAGVADRVPLAVEEVQRLADFAAEMKIDLTVVGPELPLTLGIADELANRGLAVFGPTQRAAEIEGSKVFAKQFMERHGIPTAPFAVVHEAAAARAEAARFGFPVVLKADGLAAGKGVLIAADGAELDGAVRELFEERRFGTSADRVVVEAFLAGDEVSFRRSRLNEQKLEEVTLRLSQKRAALARADRAKEELLAMLAHELRNPLGTISNALQVLRLKGDGDETRRRAIDAAGRQVLHQAMVIDDLLEASRLTRGEVELHCEEVDLKEVVRETVASFGRAFEDARLTLSLELADEPLRLRGDPLRLSQALSNLLENAAKFSSPGGRVTVRAARATSRRAEISVRDDGIGIEPEELPHVFEVFSQGDHSLDRSRGGLGVGLAVVKGLIDLHGGEVEARSEGPGKGSEFILRLPLESAADAEDGPPAFAGAKKILVVEDNPDAAAMMRDFLELSGHEVEIAASGIDGIQAARQFHPEVVLCDLGLPGMNGFEVAAELRRDPSTRSAKLIAVTGYGRDEDRRRSREAGFDLHLTKPVDPSRLRALLRERPADSTP